MASSPCGEDAILIRSRARFNSLEANVGGGYSAEYHRQYQNARYERRMAWAREELGGRCAVCGSDDYLEFDHIDPATKLHAITDMKCHSEAKFRAEVAKCQLLCKPHHVEKTRREQQTEVHGTAGMAKRCKCAECRAYGVRQTQRYRARKRLPVV